MPQRRPRQEPGRGNRPPRDMMSWNGEYFIDIDSSSHSGRERVPSGRVPSSEGRRNSPARKGELEKRRPRESYPSSGRTRPRPPAGGRGGGRAPSGSSAERRGSRGPAAYQRRQQKPLGKGARRALYFFVLLAVMVAALLLSVFLLFKISQVKVTGDVVYPAQEILRICDYQEGENLVFAPVKEQVNRLKKELPYIEEAQIVKRLPGTIEIRITGAKVSACLESGGAWLYLSQSGKILEKKEEPQAGVLEIRGIEPVDSSPGIVVTPADEAVAEVYREILQKIIGLDTTGRFTRLDLSDLYNISLWYEDRIEFLLGNAADLDYKIEFGLRIAADESSIGPKEHGKLDLTVASDVKRSTFTETASTAPSPAPSAAEPDSSAEGDPGGGESSDESGLSSQEGRTDDIPDSFYTG